MTESENIALWDKVCKTDPTHTKKFQKGGGFSGTAIKPYWVMRRATEVFGPCGLKWGWDELENKYQAGVWCSKVKVWYTHPSGPWAGQRGEIEQWGQTFMEGTNKNGPFVDEEAPKKAVTDAVTKCLSYLGFAGDVHMGLFDDSKYVAEVAEDFRNEKARQKPSIFESAELRVTFVANCQEAYSKAESIAALETLKALDQKKLDALKAGEQPDDKAAYKALADAYKAAFKRLKQPAKAQTVDSIVQKAGIADDPIPY